MPLWGRLLSFFFGRIHPSTSAFVRPLAGGALGALAAGAATASGTGAVWLGARKMTPTEMSQISLQGFRWKDFGAPNYGCGSKVPFRGWLLRSCLFARLSGVLTHSHITQVLRPQILFATRGVGICRGSACSRTRRVYRTLLESPQQSWVRLIMTPPVRETRRIGHLRGTSLEYGPPG